MKIYGGLKLKNWCCEWCDGPYSAFRRKPRNRRLNNRKGRAEGKSIIRKELKALR